MFPIYQNNNGPAYKIHCTESWGTCSIEGQSIRLLSGMLPEGATPSGCSGDCHLAFINNGNEYDLWATQWPPSGQTLNVGWGGVCSLSGPGYSSCASTATGTALSQGIVRASDLLLAAQNGGTLPYALQAAVNCSDGHVAPFTGSDGHCSGGAPQGERAYLALHDSDINATSLSAIAKALLRTVDEDHYGMIVTDTNGGASGFSLQEENDTTYTALGLPGPWVSQFVPEAQNEGLSVTDYNNLYTVTIPFDGIDLQDDMKFL
jgi:hypothetical protein